MAWTTKRRWLVLAIVVSVVVLVALLEVLPKGTSRHGPSAGSDLSSVLIDTPPTGYGPGPAEVNGPLALSAASAATVLDADSLRLLLQHEAFRRGYSRVWVNGDGYLTLVAYELGNEDGPNAVVEAVLDQVRTIPAGLVFALPTATGVRAFSTPSQRPGQAASDFCQGAWLTRGTLAVQILECSSAPPGLLTLSHLVSQEQVLLSRSHAG